MSLNERTNQRTNSLTAHSAVTHSRSIVRLRSFVRSFGGFARSFVRWLRSFAFVRSVAASFGGFVRSDFVLASFVRWLSFVCVRSFVHSLASFVRSVASFVR